MSYTEQLMSRENARMLPGPLVIPRRRLRVMHVCGVFAIVLSLIWIATAAALSKGLGGISLSGGLERGRSNAVVTGDFSGSAKEAAKMPPLDLALFDAQLWVAPPRPPEPEKPPAPIVPHPLRLQLVGIEADQTRPRAVFFDPDAIAILRAAAGEPVGGYRVRNIDSGTVMLESADRRFSHVLELRQRISLAPGSSGAIKERDVP